MLKPKKEFAAMLKAKIVEIGPEAISADDPLLILFDETASSQLRHVSVVQRFISPNEQHFSLKTGGQIKIDEQVYEVAYVGFLVADNMEMIGHATLFFEEVPEQPQHNGIYLKPYQIPKLHVGSIISYE
ncbi:PTS system, glucitol sorbitol-specific IIA component [Liquorilactobacillus nagelii DSM 13675]|nr:PTS system, glucitol sorbitol-specific IIA component [Liquorilactobacillus nagelii DSM 13675]